MCDHSLLCDWTAVKHHLVLSKKEYSPCLFFHLLRIADLTENMQNLSIKIKAFEKRELMSMEELSISVEMINEINSNIKEYLDEIEVMFTEFTPYLNLHL